MFKALRSKGFSRRNVLVGGAVVAGAQVASRATAQPLLREKAAANLTPRLAALEAAVEAARAKIGVPGAALAIVKDNNIIFQKGFGVRDTESGAPVTADTRFAIGSVSKSFTAFAAVMSADEGLLSLDESPKRLLPYFKLSDAEADAKVTIRDLLAHTTGLMRGDLVWIGGVLDREEVIRVAGVAKPTAKPRQAFQYQNAMYVAAGEAIANAHGTSWENVVAKRLLQPLGMSATSPSMETMRAVENRATGYDRHGEQLRAAMPVRRHNIAAAGGITSTAADMAQWVRLLLNRGAIKAGRLVSDAGFGEMTKPVIAAGADAYALGLFAGKRSGRMAVFHGGNIDGFEAHLFMLPAERLGFILLTNIGRSALPAAVEAAVIEHLVANTGSPAAPVVAVSPADLAAEAGRYVGPGFSADIAMRGEQLVAKFFQQPEYPLVPLGNRRFRFADPAPAGFFVTFRTNLAGAADAMLEQPQGNAAMTRLAPVQAEGGLSAAEQELVGTYDLKGNRLEIEQDGQFAVLKVPGQHPYTLRPQEDDHFHLAELPPNYRLAVMRGSDRKLAGIMFKQPEGTFPAMRTAGPMALDLSLDDVMAKAIAAVGGEETLRRHRTMSVVSEAALENLGLTATGQMNCVLPNARKSVSRLLGLGKEIGMLQITCEGAAREISSTFAETDKSGTCGSDIDYVTLLNWKTYWNSVTLERKTTLGAETVYVVRKVAADYAEIDYLSAASFRLLRRDVEAKVEGTARVVASENFSDYRAFQGVMIPMRSEGQHAIFGRIVGKVTDVRFDSTAA